MHPDSKWETLPESPFLADDEIHVLRASLERPDTRIAELEKILTAEERARAGRYHFKRDRGRFIVARGLLRSLLGLYLNCSPATLRFSQNQYGKPFLECADLSSFHFNISHSDSLVLFAFSICCQMGVDIERIRYDIDIHAVARHFFSEVEAGALASVPAALQSDAFFDCWTRKEAYIKARGEGIHFGLNNFDVSLGPGEEPALLRVKDYPEEVSRWSFHNLCLHPDYKACLAAEGRAWRLRCWHYDEKADS